MDASNLAASLWQHSPRFPVPVKSITRKLYDPAGDYFHAPPVFHGVTEGNSLLNTAPMQEEGRTAYITLSEMRELLQGLAHVDLAWQNSETFEGLGSYKKLPVSDDMEIFVGSSTARAKTKIAPTRICRCDYQ